MFPKTSTACLLLDDKRDPLGINTMNWDEVMRTKLLYRIASNQLAMARLPARDCIDAHRLALPPCVSNPRIRGLPVAGLVPRTAGRRTSGLSSDDSDEPALCPSCAGLSPCL